jgi:hypothetical protein
VVVAVVAVRMVQVPVDQVIDMIAVRDRFVAAAGAVLMGFVMLSAIVAGRAIAGVGAVHFQPMFFDPALAYVMQVAVVQVVDMVVVLDRGMAAILAVLVSVSFVKIRHSIIS